MILLNFIIFRECRVISVPNIVGIKSLFNFSLKMINDWLFGPYKSIPNPFIRVSQ